MALQYNDKALSYIAFNYEPQPGFVRKLSEAFEAVQTKFQFKIWAIAPDKYFIRNVEKRYIISFELNRLGFFGLGLDVLRQEHAKLADIFVMAFEVMGVATVKRSGLRVTAFIPVDMSHHEICKLMFGSFLQDEKTYEPLCGSPKDVLIQVHGTQRELDTKTIIAAMTGEQVGSHIASLSNLEMLVEPRLYDEALIHFRSRAMQDCLFIDNDLSRDDRTPTSIPEFLSRALSVSEYMAETSVYRLKAIQKRG
mgnify:CR=1 FL=1